MEPLCFFHPRFRALGLSVLAVCGFAFSTYAAIPDDEDSQIVVLKMDDLRRHNPTTGVHQNWIDILAMLRERGAVTTMGIVANFVTGDEALGEPVTGAVNNLNGGGQMWIDSVKAQHAAGDVEFWNHGWDHLPARDEDPSGKTQEFQASPERQQRNFARTQAAARDVLGFEFLSFGAPGNKVNADTMMVLDAHTEISARFYGDDLRLHSNAFNIRRIGGSIESKPPKGGFAPDWDVYQKAVNRNPHRPYLALQMHPELWLDSETTLVTFEQILDDLVARNVIFMTAQQLVEHIQERRAQAGPIINFDQRGDFEFLFKEAGQPKKFTETPGAGVHDSRGLAVGKGGAQTTATLQRALSGKTHAFEISIEFQHIAPTANGAQPLFMGIGPNDRYDPFLGKGRAESNHVLISYDINGTDDATRPRIRVSGVSYGQMSTRTSPYISTSLVPGAWYRLKANISKDIKGYNVEASLFKSEDPSQPLLTQSLQGVQIPELEQGQVFPFFGGQGAALKRGIGAIDNFYVSAIQPQNRQSQLLAYEGVTNKNYRKAHSNFFGSEPTTKGFQGQWQSTGGNPTLFTRPAGWVGDRNAEGGSHGIGYTATSGEELQDSFSFRKLQSHGKSPIRQLDLSAFDEFVKGEGIGAEGETLYLSFLYQPHMKDEDGTSAFALFSAGNTGANRVFEIGINRGVSDQIMAVRNGAYPASKTEIGAGIPLSVEFVVAKIEFGAGTTSGNERISIWRNPSGLAYESLQAPTAVMEDVADFTFDRIALYSQSAGASWFDEIRFGTTWQSVAPVKRDTQTHIYKSTPQRDLELWVWEPANWSSRDQRPAIVLYHGGGWGGGTPDKLKTQAKHFRDKGYVAIGVEYRLSKRDGTKVDEAIMDARSAMRYIKSNTQNFGIDPDKILALGGSAGGHLALGLSMFVDPDLNDPSDNLLIDPSPTATIALNPVANTSAPDGYGVRQKLFSSDEMALAGSPIDQARPDLPPLVIMHGDADKSVSVDHARKLRDVMVEKGNTVVYHEYPGAGHGFFNIERSKTPYNTDTLIQIDEFLDSLAF